MSERPTPETDTFAIKFKTTCGEKYWVPVDIARKLQRELAEARENCKSIVDKANELIARWDQPSWKDTAPTARFINALRIAVRAYEKREP